LDLRDPLVKPPGLNVGWPRRFRGNERPLWAKFPNFTLGAFSIGGLVPIGGFPSGKLPLGKKHISGEVYGGPLGRSWGDNPPVGPPKKKPQVCGQIGGDPHWGVAGTPSFKIGATFLQKSLWGKFLPLLGQERWGNGGFGGKIIPPWDFPEGFRELGNGAKSLLREKKGAGPLFKGAYGHYWGAAQGPI